MARVAIHSEGWQTLSWKKYQQNVYRLQKRIYRAARQGDWKRVHSVQRQKGRCAHCGLHFGTEDVIEVHHQDGNRKNNRHTNLVLLHGHCHDQAHREQYQ